MPSGFHVASAWVDVDADTDPADRKIDALIAKLETIGGKKYEARIGADAGDALAAAAKVEAALAALDKAGARVHIGADMEGVRRDIADMSADLMMQTSMFREMGTSIGVMRRDLADVSADLMMQTGLLGEIRDKLTESAGAAAVYNVQIREAGDATARAGRQGFAGWGRVGAVLRGVNAQIPLFGGALSAIPFAGAIGGVHLLVQGVLELAAVVLPAAVALTAFGAAAVPAVQDIVAKMKDLKTVSDATGQSLGPLTGGFQKVADSVRPQVYQLFGDMLTIANKKTGEFGTLAKGAGTVVDQLATRLTLAITKGKGFGQFLQSAVPDLQKLGTVVGNIGGIVANVLKQLPGYAQTLLTGLVGVTHVIQTVTGSGLAQGIIGFGLKAHGALIYAGLGATALSSAMRGTLTLAGNWAEKAGMALLATDKFGAAGVKAGGAMLGLSSRLAGLAGLPWGWIATAVAGVGLLTYAMTRVQDRTEQWVSSLQRVVMAAPVFQGLSAIMGAQAQVTQHLAAAQGQLAAAHRQVASGAAAASSQTAAENMRFGQQVTVVTQAEQKVGDLGIAQRQLADQQALYSYRVARLAVAFGGTSQAMGILTAAGITMNQMLDKTKWPQIIQQVQATEQAYQAMGQRGGMLGADLNALSIAASDQVTAMSKLNQSWDATIGIVSGGQSSFITFQQDILSVNKAFAQTGGQGRTVTQTFKGAAAAAKAAGASMNGINAPSLQLRATWQSAYANGAKLIDALRMMSSSSPGGFPSLERATKDVIAQMAPLGSLSAATRAELVSMAGEMRPGIRNWQDLTKWLGNTRNAGQDLNSILAKSGVNIQDLARDATKMSNVLGNVAIQQFTLAREKATHLNDALSKLATDMANGAGASVLASDKMAAFTNMVIKNHVPVSTAIDLISTMTGTIFKVPKAWMTKFRADNAEALRKAAEVRAALEALKNKTVYLFVNTVGQTVATPGPRGTGGGGFVHRATGGVIPGYAPGVDSVHAMLSPGEGILVPEAVRGIGGPQAIHALNRRFGGARVTRGNKTGTFASGGISTSAYGIPAGDIYISVNVAVPQQQPGYVTGATVQQIIDGLMNPHQRHQTKAQRAAAQQRVRAFEQAGLTPALEFAHGLTDITKIQAATKSAIDAIRKYYTGATMHRLISVISAQSKDLQNLAKRNDAVVAEMKAMKQYAASVTSNLGSSFSDLSNIQPMQDAKGNPIPVTGDYIASQLQLRLSRLKRFLGDIKLLAKDKLGKTLIGQVIALGPDAGVTYAEAILSGGSGLAATLRQVENEIGKVETQIGQKAAEIQYGQSISKGFLTGLQAQHSRLVREMRNLGDEIAMELARDFNDKNLLQRLRDQSSGGPGPGGFIPGHPPHHKGPGSGNGGGGIIQGHIPHHKGPGSGPHPPRKHAQPGAQPITINFQGTAFPSPEQVQSMKLALASAVSMA